GAWNLTGDATLEYVRGETDGLGDLPRMPPFGATFGLGLERDWIELRGEAAYTAEQDQTASFELPTDDFTFYNLSASLYPFEQDVRVIIEILNATDEEGRLHTSQLKDVVPLPGRSLRLGLHARF
ncbi:MAG: TonB-dependent receptor, partial [Maricaulaceae bacterium]